MATTYSIYLDNKGASTKTFWAFLERPEELAADPSVFANSSAQLAVEPNHRGENVFKIPVQYSVGAGASNKAVGLNTQVISASSEDTELGQAWEAEYFNAPPNRGPNLKTGKGKVASTNVQISSNDFDRVENEANGWFSNMSFGMETSAGYIGMTWAPDPLDKRVITPKLKFYVTTGAFGSNKLADFTTVAREAAEISLTDFDARRNATVTLTSNGRLVVTPGKPVKNSMLEDMVSSHLALCNAHAHLVGLVGPDRVEFDPGQVDTIVGVDWDDEEDSDITLLSGTITVGSAVAVSATLFVLSGINFTITNIGDGGTKVHFSYVGSQSASFVKSLFKIGAKIFVK